VEGWVRLRCYDRLGPESGAKDARSAVAPPARLLSVADFSVTGGDGGNLTRF